ncbi:MAG: hypothetical protein LBM70_03870 [Victivallales bacterium]|jgi:hypothetical protein|nr:hypothetical protein [Victivallales bacterium]
MDTLEDIGKLLSILLPILSGMAYMLRRIEKGQAHMFEKIIRIDKRKVSHKVCARRRAECPVRHNRANKVATIALASSVIALCGGCLSATRSETLEFDAAGKVIKRTVSSESVVDSLVKSTKSKTVVVWESGWLGYLSLSAATLQDPTPTAKIFAGKSDRGMVSALPEQKNWGGIADAIRSTRSDLTLSSAGIAEKH